MSAQTLHKRLLGPRAKRQLFGSGIGVAVIAAVVTAVVVTTRPSHHRPSTRSGSLARPIVSGPHLVYGMTHRQVRKLTGAPTTTQGSCWLFRPQNGMVGKISMGDPGTKAAKSNGTLKLCFVGDAFSDETRRMFYAGKWAWIGWSPDPYEVAPPSGGG